MEHRYSNLMIASRLRARKKQQYRFLKGRARQEPLPYPPTGYAGVYENHEDAQRRLPLRVLGSLRSACERPPGQREADPHCGGSILSLLLSLFWKG